MLLTDTTGFSRGTDKPVLLRCDLCGKENTTTYNNYVNGQRQKERLGLTPGTTQCKSCSSKATGKASAGRASPFKGVSLPPEARGPGHKSWRGGRFVDHYGYVMVHIVKNVIDRPSGWTSYRKEHILIMEEEIGRPLGKGELVHHIDGDRQNNDLNNLWLSDNTGHKAAHQSLQHLGYLAVRSGEVVFDSTAGKYKLKDKS
jgi:HNH endonuclease